MNLTIITYDADEWQLVPREPTPEWVAKYEDNVHYQVFAEQNIREVLAAAPQPEMLSPWLPIVPDGWMRDLEEVKGLADHLDKLAWRADHKGNVECYDQGSAMAADVIKKVLIPLIEEAPKPEQGK